MVKSMEPRTKRACPTRRIYLRFTTNRGDFEYCVRSLKGGFASFGTLNDWNADFIENRRKENAFKDIVGHITNAFRS